MVAVLLYLVGLIATLATLVVVGINGPALFNEFNAAIGAANVDIIAASLTALRRLEWALMPFVGGLLMMAAGRVVMLLSSIDRALRGNP